MKKAFIVALAAAAALVLGACGKSTDTTSALTAESHAEESVMESAHHETSSAVLEAEPETNHATDEDKFTGIIEDGVFIIEKCLSTDDTVIVPDKIDGAPVGKIRDHAFYTLPCKSIVLPDSVFYIGESAFLECKNLEQISLGNGIKAIGVYAFQSCLKLKGVSFPEGMETIEGPLFLDDEELEEVYIPISVVNLPERIASNKTCPNIVIVTPEGSEAEKIALAQGLTVHHPEGETATTPSTDTVALICERIGCTKQQAESIASRLSKLELPAITSIEKGSADDDNSITVTTEDGREYEVGIDKLYRVYSVRDMETDKYLFTITE